MHSFHQIVDPIHSRKKNRTLLDYVLQRPSYGWEDDRGELVVPAASQVLKEFWLRTNVFKTRKNWLAFTSWIKIPLLLICLAFFFISYFNIYLLGVAFVYGMIVMGTHGTIWYHRYCTHKAYTFSNKFWRFVTRNLTINIIPEEIYVVSHHVHHARSDKPGDPYNARGGFLYCFLADVNHQSISTHLTPGDYDRVVKMMAHTGTKANTYRQYRRWASVVRPDYAVVGWMLNWAFWGTVFYLLGGAALFFALFGAAGCWGLGVRTFNYEGHGKGKGKHREGIDFNRKDLSINQLWPGFVAGEWHNNHHLFPSSARSGFLPYQLDLAWCYIRFLKFIGAVDSYHDAKRAFFIKYWQPYHENKMPGPR